MRDKSFPNLDDEFKDIDVNKDDDDDAGEFDPTLAEDPLDFIPESGPETEIVPAVPNAHPTLNHALIDVQVPVPEQIISPPKKRMGRPKGSKNKTEVNKNEPKPKQPKPKA